MKMLRMAKHSANLIERETPCTDPRIENFAANIIIRAAAVAASESEPYCIREASSSDQCICELQLRLTFNYYNLCTNAHGN